MNTSSTRPPADATPVAPVLEIIRLHGAIVTAARTSLDHAIRIGQLLSEQKATLDHGQWLPWLKSNVPFAERTARNYMRCHAERDRLKSASFADLTEAYRLLTPSHEPTATEPEQVELRPGFIPQPGHWITGNTTSRGCHCAVDIRPHVDDGFFFVNAMSSDDPGGNGPATLDGTKKAIRADAVASFVEHLTGKPAEQIKWSVVGELEPAERWKYNQELFSSHQQYVDEVILGKRRQTA